MKALELFAVVMLAVALLGTGCSDDSKMAADAHPATADLATSDGSRVIADLASDQEVTASRIADTAPFVPNIGPDAEPPDLPPAYQPIPGRYVVRPDPSITDADADPIYPLDLIGLTVRVDETGKVTIFFFAAVDTDGIIPVTDGRFDFTHGRGGNDGTVCPANGYSINGIFVSPTEFRGNYVSIGFCQYQNGGRYIATLVPEIDGGTDAGH